MPRACVESTLNVTSLTDGQLLDLSDILADKDGQEQDPKKRGQPYDWSSS